jgi:hypothetical protein
MALIRDVLRVSAKGHASPITKKSETCFILACHRFNCRLGSMCPHGHPGCQLHPEAC